jgi:type VI secretion system protein ImpB
MKMSKQSESPKERINVTYKPATGDNAEEIEIPYKLTLLGDYNPDAEKIPVEDRKAIKVNKDNLNDVLKEQNITLKFDVDDKLTNNEDASLDVSLKISSMKDFSPEKIVQNVPELQKLMELRKSLVALKGPLGNLPAFREAIENAIGDETEREKLLGEITKNNENK